MCAPGHEVGRIATSGLWRTRLVGGWPDGERSAAVAPARAYSVPMETTPASPKTPINPFYTMRIEWNDTSGVGTTNRTVRLTPGTDPETDGTTTVNGLPFTRKDLLINTTNERRVGPVRFSKDEAEAWVFARSGLVHEVAQTVADAVRGARIQTLEEHKQAGGTIATWDKTPDKNEVQFYVHDQAPAGSGQDSVVRMGTFAQDKLPAGLFEALDGALVVHEAIADLKKNVPDGDTIVVPPRK